MENFKELSKKDKINLILSLKSDKHIKSYRENTIEKYCGKVLYNYPILDKRGDKFVRLVKTEKYEKVWMILNEKIRKIDK